MHVAVNVHLAKLCLLLLSAVKINVLVNSQILGDKFRWFAKKIETFCVRTEGSARRGTLDSISGLSGFCWVTMYVHIICKFPVEY